MSDPVNQHIVPDSYLSLFTDPLCPPNQEPYVWRFEKQSLKGKNKAPGSILKVKHFYTLFGSDGEKDYTVEKTLSKIESTYINLYRKKISKLLPLSSEEHVALMMFVFSMLQRTQAQKQNLHKFFDQTIEITESLEKHHDIPSKKSDELKSSKTNFHALSLIQLLPEMADFLSRMSLSFLVAPKIGPRFITSDQPCSLFNSRAQWTPGRGVGLIDRSTEVHLPLSPEIFLCLSWENLKGYVSIPQKQVDDLNRMTRTSSNKYFITRSSRANLIWFSPLPISLPFLCTFMWRQFQQWRQRRKYKGHKK